MEIKGTLPVAMTALDGQTVIKTKNIVMTALNAADTMAARGSLEAGQYVLIGELAQATSLVDADGATYPVTYDMLATTSGQNIRYLEVLRQELEEKEQAES